MKRKTLILDINEFIDNKHKEFPQNDKCNPTKWPQEYIGTEAFNLVEAAKIWHAHSKAANTGLTNFPFW